MSKKVSRRTFIKGAVGAGASLNFFPRVMMGCGDGGSLEGDSTGLGQPAPLLFISIDSLPPEYLDLDANGKKRGTKGNRLMPNVCAFLREATHFTDARDYMPAATDMNHLNAIAGTSSAQTGIISVAVQPYSWNPDGTCDMQRPHMSWARDDQGRPVDTLFNAWKRKWPRSKTIYSSGKFWVADMYRTDTSDVDIFLTGSDRPDYVDPPESWNFYDPVNDTDGKEDPESLMQRVLIQQILMKDPEHFPADSWLVDATLKVLEREEPDFGVILLAQMDDVQHAMGTAWNPDAFEEGGFRCGWRDRQNPWICREPVLDAVRDVDEQFGRLIAGLKGMDRYREATLVLYSDHGHISHLLQRGLEDGQRLHGSTDVVDILHKAGSLSDDEKDGKGFATVTACSFGILYWKGEISMRKQRAFEAKEILTAHEVVHPSTGKRECPWEVMIHEDMIRGMEGVAGPGELWHEYFGPRDDGVSPIWPDMVITMKNGWQIPLYGDVVANFGMEFPFPLPPLTVFLGGHGAPDTQRIVMAASGPGIPRGRVLFDPEYQRDFRIADLAITMQKRFGLKLKSSTVGRDRSMDLSAG